MRMTYKTIINILKFVIKKGKDKLKKEDHNDVIYKINCKKYNAK